MQTKAKAKAKAKKPSNGRAGASASYDRFKEFEGKRYTGMAVGRRHKWRYDQGEWSERKVTPDKWEFTYAVKKRRAGKAPEGSGAPTGTAYRWYILAEQVVTKLDANTYSTEMVGLKHKLAHKRADKGAWSASDRAQNRQLAKLLRAMADDLDRADTTAATVPARPAAAAPAKAGSRPAPASRPTVRKTPTPRRRATAVSARPPRRTRTSAAHAATT